MAYRSEIKCDFIFYNTAGTIEFCPNTKKAQYGLQLEKFFVNLRPNEEIYLHFP